MSLMNTTKTAIAKLAEYDMKQHASLLKWTTLIIWTASLIAEVGTFWFNKKLPPKEKHFIIRQEIAAGGASLLLTYIVADPADRLGGLLLEKGKILPKALPESLRNPAVIKKILAEDPNTIKTLLNNDRFWVDQLLKFRKGLNVITGTLGLIIGFNLITPLVSNKIGSYFHNKTLDKDMRAMNQHPPQKTTPLVSPHIVSPSKSPVRPTILTYSQPHFNVFSR